MTIPKEEVYQACRELLSAKITDLQKMIASINESKNNETKSSAGDKYETGRAMMQMEEDKITNQLELTQQMLGQLEQIPPVPHNAMVRVGSLIKTDQRTYFLSVSLGKVTAGGKTVFCLSPSSPIGQLLLGKAPGEVITFNGRKEHISEIR